MVGQHPVREYPLVDLAHLPWPGYHAAAVDHRLSRYAARYSSISNSAASLVVP